MSTINPFQGIDNTASGTSSLGSKAEVPNAIGKDGFLKLLVGQLRTQDPMNPSSDKDFIGTMAQFSMLEQVTNLNKSNEQMQKTLASDHATSLIGKKVTYKGDDGADVQGTVDKVSIVDGDATLTVGGKTGIAIDKVTEVA